jgi:hypothetical protein
VENDRDVSESQGAQHESRLRQVARYDRLTACKTAEDRPFIEVRGSNALFGRVSETEHRIISY